MAKEHNLSTTLPCCQGACTNDAEGQTVARRVDGGVPLAACAEGKRSAAAFKLCGLYPTGKEHAAELAILTSTITFSNYPTSLQGPRIFHIPARQTTASFVALAPLCLCDCWPSIWLASISTPPPQPPSPLSTHLNSGTRQNTSATPNTFFHCLWPHTLSSRLLYRQLHNTGHASRASTPHIALPGQLQECAAASMTSDAS